MDVLSNSRRNFPVSQKSTWAWFALVPAALFGVFALTGSFVTALLGGMAAAVLVFVLNRGSQQPEPPDATHFTPPYGVPAIRVDDPRSVIVPRIRAVPKTHAPTAAKDVAVEHQPGKAFEDLDYDPVGRLVHGLRSEGLATLRSKVPAVAPATPAKGETKAVNVYVRDDRDIASGNQKVMGAVRSVDSLMTYLVTGTKEVGYEAGGWTVTSAQTNETTGRWTAVLQHKTGSTVVLNLVDPATFSAAVRGTNRTQQMSQSHDMSRGISRQLNAGTRR